MSDDVVLDGSLFFRARRTSRPPPRDPIYRTLWLDTDVSVCDLIQALRGSGLVVSTTAGGTNVIHRGPRPDDAA